MGTVLIIGAGLAALAGSLAAATRRRHEPIRAARIILAGTMICVLLVSAGVVVSIVS